MFVSSKSTLIQVELRIGSEFPELALERTLPLQGGQDLCREVYKQGLSIPEWERCVQAMFSDQK